MKKFFYYVKNFSYNALPESYFKSKYHRLKAYEKICNTEELNNRLLYYFKFDQHFNIPNESIAVSEFRRKNARGSGYYFDFKEFLHYFAPHARFAYHFGDETHVNPYPTIFKARPIEGDNTRSVLFKLNKKRHFQWVNDPLAFKEKKDIMVWRGGAYLDLRRKLVERLWNHPLCNIGQTNKPKENAPWQKKYMSKAEQLNYKFIFCPEGNDVATNLKWAMSSNSLCIMPKPRYETWFMEGTLEAGKHYVEISGDPDELTEKLSYYTIHKNEAEAIIHNAHEHVKKFWDKDLEDLLCLKVLERYIEFSGQQAALRFRCQ